MNLTSHFTLDEFSASDTAARKGINNNLPGMYMRNAIETCSMLERVRAYLSSIAGHEVPIQITSGYRSAELNNAIGSKATSLHTRALAADIKAPAFGNANKVAVALAQVADDLDLGQVIYEFGAWTHLSVSKPHKGVNRLLTINSLGTHPGILEA